MSEFRLMKYVGDNIILAGKTALVKDDPDDPDIVQAQFDDTELGALACNWHRFGRALFGLCENQDQTPEGNTI